jgi:hypothetical protein
MKTWYSDVARIGDTTQKQPMTNDNDEDDADLRGGHGLRTDDHGMAGGHGLPDPLAWVRTVHVSGIARSGPSGAACWSRRRAGRAGRPAAHSGRG